MKCSDSIPDFSEFPVFNPQNMEKLRSQTSGRPELLQEIIESFLEESFEIVDEINKHSAENNLEMLARSVHTLKGLAGTIGASRLYQILSHVDACHKSNSFLFKDSLSETFEKNLQNLKLYFKDEGFIKA
ncbi:MAG: Hpt domain-containing protein [Bacteroidota bacterium]